MEHNREELYYEEEEVSLFDIVDILLRYKKKIMTIVVIGIILSFGGALIARKFRIQDTFQEYRLQYAELENDYYYQLIGLSYIKFDLRDILQVEKYIDRFLVIPELKKLYEKEKSDNPKLELYDKREFINEIMRVEKVEGYDKLIVTLDVDTEVAPQVIDIYFEILKEEILDKLKFLLTQTKESALIMNANAVERLNDIKKQLSEVLAANSFKANNMQDLDFLVSLKYPLLISNKNLYQSIYSKSSQQITGIDIVLQEGKIGKLIEKKGSIVVEKSKSKAILVLLGGTVLSVMIAFMMVVISEMLESYKKHKKEIKAIEHK